MKSGIDYFPLDVSLDDKFELIEAEFGLTGFAVVVKLFQKIYGGQGYYCEWTREVALLFGKKIGLGGNAVSEIVQASIRRGIFDADLFEKYNILTSAGIQKRFFEAVGRRKSVIVKKEYLLVSCTQNIVFADISSENVNKTDENVYISEQSKVKESKVKKSKEYIGAPAQKRAACPDELFPMILSNGKEKGFSQQMIDQWKKSYPLVDVEQKLKKMQSWCLSNPQKRKTASGITRFANSWLSRAQEEAKAKQKPAIRYESDDIFSDLPELELEDV